MGDLDVYKIARLLNEEYGVDAVAHVEKKIEQYINVKDYNATKSWYEIEDALKEVQASLAESKATAEEAV